MQPIKARPLPAGTPPVADVGGSASGRVQSVTLPVAMLAGEMGRVCDLGPPPRPHPSLDPSVRVGGTDALDWLWQPYRLRTMADTAARFAALPWLLVWVLTLGRLGKPLSVRIHSGDPEEAPCG